MKIEPSYSVGDLIYTPDMSTMAFIRKINNNDYLNTYTLEFIKRNNILMSQISKDWSESYIKSKILSKQWIIQRTK